jgi:3-dehydroquinate synthase
VFDELTIQSHAGPYTVIFKDALPTDAGVSPAGEPHFLIDANVARLYAGELQFAVNHRNAIVIEATEESKSLQQTIPVFERLISNSIRRDHVLVAIGGGIIQDITCFVASTLLRGLPWIFVPTTLLAQADSCIGSKSSINLGDIKNVLGTFKPPVKVLVHSGFLETLDRKDIHSGVGEIIKVHAIAGVPAFDGFAMDFNRVFSDRAVLLKYVGAALRIKQPYIEKDEFDCGIRNVLNYGHSFGHAIESATHYAVPHGIAVTMGMDMANYVAVKRGELPIEHYDRMHDILRKNYAAYARTNISAAALLSALTRDKKNTSTALRLVLPKGAAATIAPILVASDAMFRSHCERFLKEMAA